MKPSIGDVVILNFKAHNQITAGPNSSKVLLFRGETNLVNVTRRKLLRSPDRNICRKGKSILNRKESRKGDHIDVQPAIKKKRQRPPKPLEAKTENVATAIRNENAPGKELALPSLRREPPWSELLRETLPARPLTSSPGFHSYVSHVPPSYSAFARSPRRSPPGFFTPSLKLHTASEMLIKRMRGEARGHRARSSRPEMVG